MVIYCNCHCKIYTAKSVVSWLDLNSTLSSDHVLIAFIVLIVVVTTVSLAIVLNREPDGVRTQPNILVVIADDLGYNDVGYQGPGDIKTPYIDHLAR